MTELRARHPIIHFVGSIPLQDAETVFRTLAESAGSCLRRLPDGETGIRKAWIRFLQQVLADKPGDRGCDRRTGFQVHAMGRQASSRDPAPARQAWCEAGFRDVRNRLCRDGDRFVEPIRAIADSRCHPGDGQIPNLAADTDCSNLQQYGPL